MKHSQDQPVALVTGGARGIGAAAALSLGADGYHVVTIDPEVSITGSEREWVEGPSTAERIISEGGSAEASDRSVEDLGGLQQLVFEILGTRGRLDAVVNVAGNSRPTSFLKGDQDDWAALLGVHLGGYLNVLAAVLPAMVAAGRGHVLGVTSGGGWRPADAGGYSVAKRSVASLTWELAPLLPEGILMNALSPIAYTRMVAAALGRQANSEGSSTGTHASGGLALGVGMPDPSTLGPMAAHLAKQHFTALRGAVVFLAGSEVALIEPPGLIEVLRAERDDDLTNSFRTVIPTAFSSAENMQRTAGASNERFRALFELAPPSNDQTGPLRNCVLAVADPELRNSLHAHLEGVSFRCIDVDPRPTTWTEIEQRLSECGVDVIDAVVHIPSPLSPNKVGESSWNQVLDEHQVLRHEILNDAGWVRAAATVRADSPRRIISLVPALTAGGRTRAQALGQLARASRGATENRVSAFAVSLEGTSAEANRAAIHLIAHLLGDPLSDDLSGAELVVSDGWIGLRRHPGPTGSVILGDEIPSWFDAVISKISSTQQRG